MYVQQSLAAASASHESPRQDTLSVAPRSVLLWCHMLGLIDHRRHARCDSIVSDVLYGAKVAGVRVDLLLSGMRCNTLHH